VSGRTMVYEELVGDGVGHFRSLHHGDLHLLAVEVVRVGRTGPGPTQHQGPFVGAHRKRSRRSFQLSPPRMRVRLANTFGCIGRRPKPRCGPRTTRTSPTPTGRMCPAPGSEMSRVLAFLGKGGGREILIILWDGLR